MTRKKTGMNDSSSSKRLLGLPPKHGLYDPANEKDSCGVGFVAHIKGERSHQIILDADQILRNMDHRGACGCEADTGDGAGMMTALPPNKLNANCGCHHASSNLSPKRAANSSR